MLPTNQPTATGVALCHEKDGGPQFKKINNRHGISGFHRASLLSVTFINQLMHSIITIVDYKICIIQKSKRHTLKYSNLFRITWDPSSGSDELYLIEITYNGSIVLIMCVVGVWRQNSEIYTEKCSVNRHCL